MFWNHLVSLCFVILVTQGFQTQDMLTVEEEGTIIKSVTSLGLAYSACYLRYCDHKCNTSDTKWYPMCHCDRYCEPLRDCCYGYQECVKNRLHDDVMMQLLILGVYVSCDRRDPWFPDNSMVRKCPKNAEKDLTQKCNDLRGLIPVENKPVYHHEYGLSFRNVYCALCHAISLEDLLPWGIVTEGRCQTPNTETTIVDHVTASTNYTYCLPDTVADRSVTDRRCAPNDKRAERFCDVEGRLRNHCDSKRKVEMGATTFKFVEEACQAYEAPILVQEKSAFVLYKNSFCVECSQYSSKDLRCPPYYCELVQIPRMPLPKPPIPRNDSAAVKYEVDKNVDRLLFAIRSMRRRCRYLPSVPSKLRQDCREGFMKNGEACLPDLLDNATYAKPVISENSVLTMSLSVTFTESLRFVITGYDMGPELRRMCTKLLDLLLPFVTVEDVQVTSNLTTNSMIGGTEVTFESGLSLQFRVSVENQTDTLGVDELVSRLLQHARGLIDVYPGLEPKIVIATGNVSFPIRCPRGQHLIIPLDREYFSLYRHNYDADEFMRDLVLVFNPHESKYPVMHGCTKPVIMQKPSRDCQVMVYERDDFSAIGDKLVFQYTSIRLDKKDYYVVDNKLYTCIVLPRGERVISPVQSIGSTAPSFSNCDVFASTIFILFTAIVL